MWGKKGLEFQDNAGGKPAWVRKQSHCSVPPRFIQNCENSLKVMAGGNNLEVETDYFCYTVFGMAASGAQYMTYFFFLSAPHRQSTLALLIIAADWVFLLLKNFIFLLIQCFSVQKLPVSYCHITHLYNLMALRNYFFLFECKFFC